MLFGFLSSVLVTWPSLRALGSGVRGQQSPFQVHSGHSECSVGVGTLVPTLGTMDRSLLGTQEVATCGRPGSENRFRLHWQDPAGKAQGGAVGVWGGAQ